jgi:integrase
MIIEKRSTSISDAYSLFLYAMNSPVTRDRYTTRLRRFFSFIGIKGEVEEQCRIFIEKVNKDNEFAFRSIISFLHTQKERVDRKEITGSTIRNYIKAIKLFTEMNDISISWKKIIRGLPKGRKSADDRASTLDEIRKIVEYPDRRIKPIVYTMVSSGIRLGAWDYFRWGHIQPIYRKDEIVAAKILVYAGEDEQYNTHISPEAYRALADWIEFRRKSGETINSDSWVMRNLWDNRVTKGKGWITVPKRLKSSGVKALVENAIWTQGLRKKLPPGKRRHEFQADHGFRKFFKSRAEQVMKPINVEILMSHSTGVSDSYYRPIEKDLLEDYLKAVDMLSVNDDKLTLQKQVAELTEKSKEENYIIKGKLSEKEKEIEELRHNDKVKEDALATLSDQVMKLMVEVQELKKQK